MRKLLEIRWHCTLFETGRDALLDLHCALLTFFKEILQLSGKHVIKYIDYILPQPASEQHRGRDLSREEVP